MSVEDYAKGSGSYFAQHAFYESPIVNRVEAFGNVSQVFSSYESRRAPGEAPFARGINSIQLMPRAKGARRQPSSQGICFQVVRDRKSTRLNSSHGYISYAVFCLENKKHIC